MSIKWHIYDIVVSIFLFVSFLTGILFLFLLWYYLSNSNIISYGILWLIILFVIIGFLFFYYKVFKFLERYKENKMQEEKSETDKLFEWNPKK